MDVASFVSNPISFFEPYGAAPPKIESRLVPYNPHSSGRRQRRSRVRVLDERVAQLEAEKVIRQTLNKEFMNFFETAGRKALQEQ